MVDGGTSKNWRNTPADVTINSVIIIGYTNSFAKTVFTGTVNDNSVLFGREYTELR